MEAKDTVMDEEEKLVCSLVSEFSLKRIHDVIDETCEHQAEISFPLGKQEGIKEVVEDMEKAMDITKPGFTIHAAFKCLEKWQAFLKERGLK